jgi:RTX calcium-binding nonapeptide repeat (4 copies)
MNLRRLQRLCAVKRPLPTRSLTQPLAAKEVAPWGDSSRGHRSYLRSWATRRHDVDSARFRHLTRSNYTTHAAASRASFRQIRMLSVVEDLARRRRIRPLDLRILGIRRVRRANLTTGTALFHSDSGEISDVSQLLSIEALAGTQDHADILTGDQGSNVLYGAFDPSQGYVDGGDSLNGVSGDDQLYGLTGNDELNGGDGDDSVVGGRGKDRLDGGLGVNSNDGGRGIDFCVNPDTAGAPSTARDPNHCSGMNTIDDAGGPDLCLKPARRGVSHVSHVSCPAREDDAREPRTQPLPTASQDAYRPYEGTIARGRMIQVQPLKSPSRNTRIFSPAMRKEPATPFRSDTPMPMLETEAESTLPEFVGNPVGRRGLTHERSACGEGSGWMTATPLRGFWRSQLSSCRSLDSSSVGERT